MFLFRKYYSNILLFGVFFSTLYSGFSQKIDNIKITKQQLEQKNCLYPISLYSIRFFNVNIYNELSSIIDICIKKNNKSKESLNTYIMKLRETIHQRKFYPFHLISKKDFADFKNMVKGQKLFIFKYHNGNIPYYLWIEKSGYIMGDKLTIVKTFDSSALLASNTIIHNAKGKIGNMSAGLMKDRPPLKQIAKTIGNNKNYFTILEPTSVEFIEFSINQYFVELDALITKIEKLIVLREKNVIHKFLLQEKVNIDKKKKVPSYLDSSRWEYLLQKSKNVKSIYFYKFERKLQANLNFEEYGFISFNDDKIMMQCPISKTFTTYPIQKKEKEGTHQ